MYWVKYQSIGFIIRTKFCVSRYYCQSYRIIFPEAQTIYQTCVSKHEQENLPRKTGTLTQKVAFHSIQSFNHSPILNFQPPLIFLKGNCFVPFLFYLQTHCSANHQCLITNTTSVFSFLTST